MEPFRGNYFSNYHMIQHEEYNNQYYDQFYVKHRKRTTKAQLKVLEKAFENCPRPDSIMRKKLGEQLAMTPRSVQVWFQNRRAKVKKQQQCDKPNSPSFHRMEKIDYSKPIEQYELYPMNNSVMLRVPPPYNYENGYQYVNNEDIVPYNMYEQRFDKKMYPYE